MNKKICPFHRMMIMKKYRCLLNGQNFLIKMNGVPAKHGFFQNLMVEANHPQQAELLAMARLWHDEDLKKITLNTKKDKPIIRLATIWEMDVVNGPHEAGPDRAFYKEPEWWRFWEMGREQKKLEGLFFEFANPSNEETG
ncbi:MAG: hypothetical protein KKA41_07560 [Proteobacteria bacterium]|nr:hypothetical protein [Pseudomonadota bacterium]